MVDAVALSRAERGSVIAPAGCGKTELIARAVHEAAARRVLVLTHTHAGVKALRNRLARMGVSRDSAQVDTIAGWCLRYACSYPSISGLVSPEPAMDEWEGVYDAAGALLRTRAIQAVISASYEAVYVDEYQDCTPSQHAVITALAEVLPCRVLGDPLQGIFGFAGGTLSWKADIESTFPSLGELRTPWRWNGRNERLGQWLLDLRTHLIEGRAINLKDAPIYWAESTPENHKKLISKLMKTKNQVVAIHKWPQHAHRFARRLGGAIDSMEEIECKDLLSFAEALDEGIGTQRALQVLDLAKGCMTSVSTQLKSVTESLQRGQSPNLSGVRKNRDVIEAITALIENNDPHQIRAAMHCIEKMEGVKQFRGELWLEAKRTVQEIEHGRFASYRQAAWTLRNRLRYSGRPLQRKLVSRPLLIKGLEFDHALILDGDEFEDNKRPGDGAKHFYVSATRGAQSLAVLSRTPEVKFSAAII